MEMKQIITATVAVILICLVAIPLIDSSTENVHTTTQNTTQRYYATSAEGLSEDLTITLESEGNYTINGTSYEISPSYIVIIAQPYMWVLYSNNYNMYTEGSTWLGLGIGGSTTFKQDGTFVSTTSTGTTKGGTFSSIIYPSLTGSLGYFQNKAAYADANSEIIFFSMSGTLFAQKWKADGTFVESLIGPITNSGASTTITDAAVTYNTIDKGIADYSVKSLSFKNNDTTSSTGYFIAPIEYETITNNDNTIITILQLIPVLLIASLIIGIGYNIARRD